MTIIIAILTIIAAYLIGSINFAVIFSKAFTNSDIREKGSGNAGTTNVMRENGFLPGLLTFIFDAVKGFAACQLGAVVFSMVVEPHFISDFAVCYAGAYYCGVACMLGHIYPIFFKFRGGKGVAISVGIFSVCCPMTVIIGLSVFFLVTIISKYVSLGSLVATISVIVTATIFRNDATPAAIQIVCCLAMAALIFFKHSENIKRLITGKERRIR